MKKLILFICFAFAIELSAIRAQADVSDSAILKICSTAQLSNQECGSVYNRIVVPLTVLIQREYGVFMNGSVPTALTIQLPRAGLCGPIKLSGTVTMSGQGVSCSLPVYAESGEMRGLVYDLKCSRSPVRRQKKLGLLAKNPQVEQKIAGGRTINPARSTAMITTRSAILVP